MSGEMIELHQAPAPRLRAAPPERGYDVEAVRRDFPGLAQLSRGQPLAYLDNAATTQKPAEVIEALASFYRDDCANVHRAVYELGERATARFEAARDQVRRFLNAPRREEVIFVRGATEALNLVATVLARARLKPGDEIIISGLEHHSNIVPWQLACEQTGARLRVVPFQRDGDLMLDQLERLLGPNTRLVAVTQVANSIGTVNPIPEIVARAHARRVPVLVDGAQAAPHLPVDVQALGCDFYAFSGHKLYGPTGIGVLWGRHELLDSLPPYQGGGDMIRSVTFEKTIYAPLPSKFEGGTPHIAGAVGLAAALAYLERLGRQAIASHEAALLAYAEEQLTAIPGLRLFGRPRQRAGVLAFALERVHPHDLATIVDQHGVAIRAGHHCAQPVWPHFGVNAAARASFGLYNTRAEVDRLVAALAHAGEVFR